MSSHLTDAGSHLTGDGSRISGDGSRISGDGNRISGDGSRISGDGNRLTGEGAPREARPRSLRVMKFGGSSVGTPERLLDVIDIITSRSEAGPVAVVVSAMGDTTDDLVEAADLAARGDVEGAEQAVDRVADLAIANGLMVMRSLEARRGDVPKARKERRRPPPGGSVASQAARSAPTGSASWTASAGAPAGALGAAPAGAPAGAPAASLGAAPAMTSGGAPAITPMVRETLAPLRQLLHGVALLRERTPQTLDLVMSFGERLSARVLTELLSAQGVPALFVDSRDWIVTDEGFGDALVVWEKTRERIEALGPSWRGLVPVNTGFIGSTPDGRTTTLGRNGSDYTATLLARGLGASEVIIWTDVPGVMTADPALVREAYPLSRMSYMEALELANFGARMFHPRTMIPLMESGIPLRISNTGAPELPGTLIDQEGAGDVRQPTSVTSLENQALLDIQWRRLAHHAPLGERTLAALGRTGVTVWMATQAAHGQALAVVVPEAQVEIARAAIAKELAVELERGELEGLRERRPVTLLTLVAEAMGRLPNIAGRLFYSLGSIGVKIRAIGQGASDRSISCVIDASDTPLAVRTVHAAFNLAHEEVSLLVLGRGVVGSALLRQIRDQGPSLEKQHDIRLKVVGLASSRAALFDAEGLETLAAAEALEEAARGERPGQVEKETPSSGTSSASVGASVGTPAPLSPDILPLLERLRRLPVPILVDCTAAGGMEAIYPEAFARGVHVVAANKKPLTVAASRVEALHQKAREHHRAYRYETTVGASLPVIETLQNLVRTGDRVLLIEGSFSGTLGYITGQLMEGLPLSQVVRRARELGYTEPRPQDDLSGLDVARKALILARELGLRMELEDVVVEPLVPAALLAEPDVDAFLVALERHDAELAARTDAMKSEGRTLRYLARVEPGAEGRPVLEVGPVGIPAEHPATRLRGAESFVAFTTERYQEYPLIVQGAGAGGDVTAAGVLADILRIAQTLRGN